MLPCFTGEKTGIWRCCVVQYHLNIKDQSPVPAPRFLISLHHPNFPSFFSMLLCLLEYILMLGGWLVKYWARRFKKIRPTWKRHGLIQTKFTLEAGWIKLPGVSRASQWTGNVKWCWAQWLILPFFWRGHCWNRSWMDTGRNVKCLPKRKEANKALCIVYNMWCASDLFL